MLNKVIIILGTTASGKTKLAVKLAQMFGGEIISADSRQVYRGMDIGTGKDSKEYQVKSQISNLKTTAERSKLNHIPYHLIDVADPKKQFTVAEWQRMAYEKINDILRRGKVPIVCGGTGLYISALVEGYQFRESRIKNQESRIKLNKLSLKQLLLRLKKIDLKTYKVIDKNNRRRVQRALEIYYETGRPKSELERKQKPPYDFLLLGLTFPRETLKRRIEKRLKERLEKENMIGEIRKLHRQGVSWKRLEEFGLEYRFIASYLQKKITYQQMLGQLLAAIYDFAKRQMTWFKRDKKIIWLKDFARAKKEIRKFLF